MRLSRSLFIAVAALCMAGTVAAPAEARRPRKAFAPAPSPPAVQPLVSLSLEQPGGGALPSFFHVDSLYFAGQKGQRYDLRLTNNTGDRVEVVVTVDGRDVISGEVGNFKKQRGYVIDPWGTVLVSGFRQSQDQVAAFRFSDLAGSYTAQMGTPQHAGVVGVAVFREKERSARRHRKRAMQVVQPPPPTEPYYRGGGRSSVPSAFPDSPSAASRDEAESAERRPAPRDGGFAPEARTRAPRQLGTAYGESQMSSVEEVAFKRHRRRRPDAFLTVYYDSAEGLMARGVYMGVPAPYREPQPFAQPGFAAPPNGRR